MTRVRIWIGPSGSPCAGFLVILIILLICAIITGLSSLQLAVKDWFKYGEFTTQYGQARADAVVKYTHPISEAQISEDPINGETLTFNLRADQDGTYRIIIATTDGSCEMLSVNGGERFVMSMHDVSVANPQPDDVAIQLHAGTNSLVLTHPLNIDDANDGCSRGMGYRPQKVSHAQFIIVYPEWIVN